MHQRSDAIDDDPVVRSSKSFAFSCGADVCDYSYIIDQSSDTIPSLTGFTDSESLTVSDGDGTYTLHVIARDNAGNISEVERATFLVDTSAPTAPSALTMLAPLSTPNKEAEVQLQSSGLVPGDTLTLWGDQNCTESLHSFVISETSETFDYTLTEAGVVDFHVSSSDSVGNQSPCSASGVRYTFDNQINDISEMSLVTPSSSPANDDRPTIAVAGVSAGDSVRLFKVDTCFASQQVGFALADSDSVEVRLTMGSLADDGSYTIYGQSFDEAGNISECTPSGLAYTLDRQAPSAPSGLAVTNPLVQPATSLTPTVEVQGVTSGDTVAIYSDSSCSNILGGKAVAVSPESFNLNPLPSDGIYNLFVRAEDSAGNKSSCADHGVQYVLDVSAPTLTYISLATGGGSGVVAVGGQVILSFTASEPLSPPNVVILGQTVTPVHIGGNHYQATHTTSASDPAGAVTFSVNYADSSGNAGPERSTTTDGSSLTYDNTDFSPQLSISNQNGSEDVHVQSQC